MSDLDKTIEELEAEINQELEEATDAPKKGAAKGDSMEKVDGEVQDLGPAVVDPEAKTSGPSKADDKVKQDKSAPTKGAAAAEKPEKVKEETESDEEEITEGKMTKEMMKQEMQKKMEGMKMQELKAAYDAMVKEEEDEDDDDDDEEEMEESIDARIASVDVSEDVAALTHGEDLSEEFKEKASTIFEAAVKSKLRPEVARLEKQYRTELDEELTARTEDLVEKVDTYLSYVVQEWMSENELAIERGLKGEIAEDFINGLKELFTEHYIDVPEERYDVLESQSTKIDVLESKLNEQIEKNADLNKMVGELVRESVVVESCEGLTVSETEKLKELVEGVEFTDAEDFSEKVAALREAYFPTSAPLTESVVDDVTGTEEIDTTGAMAAYLAAISKTKKA